MLEKPVDFGRRIGVSRQCIADYVKRKQISGDALVGSGRSLMIDVEKATAQLARRLDPDKRLTNGRAKLDRSPAADRDPADALGYFAPMASYEDPAHRGAVAMGLFLVHMAGAAAGLAAIEAGAPVKVAYRLREITTINTMEMVEMFMADLGIPTEPMLYTTEAMADVDWRRAATMAGEPYDPAAWKAHAVAAFRDPA